MPVTIELQLKGDDSFKDIKNLKTELAGANEEYKKLNQAAAESGKAMVNASTNAEKSTQELSSAMAKQAQQIKQQQALIDQLSREYEELRKTSRNSLDPVEASKYTEEIKALKKEIEALKAAASKGSKKLEVFAPGSVADAEASLKRLRGELAGLDAQQLKSKWGKELKKDATLAEKELKKLQVQAGLTAESGNLLNKSWSFLRTAAYLIPGLGIAGIIGIITDAVVDLVQTFTKAEEAFDGFKNVQIDAAKATKEQEVVLRAAIAVANDYNASTQARYEAVKKINDIMPDNLKGITEEGLKTEETKNKIEEYIKSLRAKALAQAYASNINKAYSDLLDIENSAVEDNISRWERMINVLKSGDADPFGQIGDLINGRDLMGGSKKLDEETAAKNREERAKKQLDNIKKLEDKFIADLASGRAKFDLEDDKKDKEKTDKKKKHNEDRLRDAKDYSDKIIALEKQLAAARIAALEEGLEKDTALENARFENAIKSAKNNIAQYYDEIAKVRKAKMNPTEQAKEIRQLKQLISLENGLIEQEQISHYAKLGALQMKYFEDARKALEASQDAVDDVYLTGKEKELKAVEDKYSKLFKTIEDARKKALGAASGMYEGTTGVNAEFDTQQAKVTEAQEKETLAIIRKYDLAKIKEQEEFGIAEAQLLTKQGVTAENIERLREIAVLKVKIDAAKQRIDLLKKSGSAEDQLQVKQLEAFISESTNKIDQLEGQMKGKDLLSILGIRLKQEEQRDLFRAAQSFTDSVMAIYKNYIDQRINEQDRLIDKLQEDIQKQEDIVEKEKELAEKGLANNLDVAQRQLDDLKRRNNEEVAEMKKLQKEQMAYAKAQQVIQGIITATKLGAAAATYFAEGATAGPVVGVALALAAVASMVATFATLKQQTKELSNYTTYREGGGFDARGDYPTHEQGGIDVMVNGKKKAEFQKGEYAYFFKNAEKAKKFESFFDRINSGQLSNMRVTPSGMIIHEDHLKNVTVNPTPVVVIPNDNTDYLRSIDTNVRKLATVKTVREETDTHIIETTGNHIRRIRKNG